VISRSILAKIRPDIERALEEDCPRGDITSEACVPAETVSRAVVKAKEDMFLAGLQVFGAVMKIVDGKTRITFSARDGDRAGNGSEVIHINGKSRSILKAERVALNYLQRMCGIATLTARFVAEVKDTGAIILDTRKTTPNMRLLEKYGVTCGGGRNHRISLSDAPLIKENHVASAGGIAEAVRRVKKKTRKPVLLEVRNRAEVLEGLSAGAEILMLDNMKPAQVKRMVGLINGRALVEVSGGVTLKNVRRYALAGADRISIGALTHSAPSADLSLLFV